MRQIESCPVCQKLIEDDVHPCPRPDQSPSDADKFARRIRMLGIASAVLIVLELAFFIVWLSMGAPVP